MSINQPVDRYINLGHIRLHYLEWGNPDSQVLLMLHGIMGHAHIWDDVSRRLRDRYHIIALDQRGHGGSQRPKAPCYGMDDYFRDLASIIQVQNLKKIILIGHSMGGRNAIFYAACNPERIDRLILVDVRPGNSEYASKALRELFINFPLKAPSLEHVTEKIMKLYPRLPEETAYAIAKYGYRKNRHGIFVPRYDQRMAELSETSGYQADDLSVFLRNIKCPTLVMRGEESLFITREDADRVCGLIPQAEYREIKKASHMPAQENPEEFLKILCNFLSC